MSPTFENLDIRGEDIAYYLSGIERCSFRDVRLAQKAWAGERHGVGPARRPAQRARFGL